MALNRRMVLLGGLAILAIVVVWLRLSIVATAQEPVQGVYWKPDDTKTSYNLPRVSSETQPASQHTQQSLPNPYDEVDNFLRIPDEMVAAGRRGAGFDHVGASHAPIHGAAAWAGS